MVKYIWRWAALLIARCWLVLNGDLNFDDILVAHGVDV